MLGNRRQFLKTVAGKAAFFAVPLFVPGKALGLDGAVAPSQRITVGGIGVGGVRGSYVLSVFLGQPDVQFLAVCDVRDDRRLSVKNLVDAKNGNRDCKTYRDLRDLLARRDIDAVLISIGDRWHATASILAVQAGKDVYCEKPCAMTIELAAALDDNVRRYGRVFQAGTQRRNVSNYVFAVDLARTGKLGKLLTLYAGIGHLRERHDWLPAEPEPPREVMDWDLWLGPCPWRPYNHQYAYVNGGWHGFFDFEAGGGLLDWGAHTVDLCQWANNADRTLPVFFEPAGNNRLVGKYQNGVKLVLQNTGWLGLGGCPIRFEGEEGWVETGDSGIVALHPDSLRSQQKTLHEPGGISCVQHVRDFLNCVKTRALPAANSQVARKSHIACFAAYLAWRLGRRLNIDVLGERFIGDEEANRMRSRAIRAPWYH